MKLEIQIEGIFADDDGYDVQDAVKDSIIKTVSDKLFIAISKQTETVIAKSLTTAINEKVDAFLKEILPGMLDYEFTEVSSWGSTGKTTTVRNRILESLQKNSEYKANCNWDSDKNTFTKVIDGIVKENFDKFKKDYALKIDSLFVQKCFDHAQKELQKTLGIKEAK